MEVKSIMKIYKILIPSIIYPELTSMVMRMLKSILLKKDTIFYMNVDYVRDGQCKLKILLQKVL